MSLRFVLVADNEEELFNPNCVTVNLLDNLRRRCGCQKGSMSKLCCIYLGYLTPYLRHYCSTETRCKTVFSEQLAMSPCLLESVRCAELRSTQLVFGTASSGLGSYNGALIHSELSRWLSRQIVDGSNVLWYKIGTVCKGNNPTNNNYLKLPERMHKIQLSEIVNWFQRLSNLIFQC